MKYGGVTLGQVEAAINKLGGQEVWDAWLRGEREVTVSDVIQLLVDRHGRCIPIKPEVGAAVCDPNRNFRFGYLAADHDFAATLELWQQRFSQNPGIDGKEFVERIAALKANIEANRQISNLVGPNAAPFFPLILPQIPLQPVEGSDEAKQEDYGQLLERLLLAVEASYLAAYPERKFINNRQGQLAGQVIIIEYRHAKLYVDLTNGPIVGLLFPAALHGFSQFAQRQMITLMPNSFSLQGPLDMAVAETMYPIQLSRDKSTPLKDCSAVQWRSLDYSMCFGADNIQLGFGFGGLLGYANAHYAGGLFFRG